MTTTSASDSGSTSKKRTIKRKLDESVLKKAREALGLPLESPEDDEKQDEPSVKWRKPRHNTAEGQKYVENKEKRKKLESEGVTSQVKPSSAGKDDKKKSKKKRKKKKAKTVTTPAEKNPDSEKRHGMEAISYLQLWASNRDHWKFEKLKQTWLLKNCLSSNLMDDKRFEILLQYITSIKGAARKATLTEMQSFVTKYEMSGRSKSGTEEGKSDVVDASKSNSDDIKSTMYDRARQIVQMLTDD